MEKLKPTTLVGWQKLYPDAIRIQASATSLFNDQQLIYHATGGNKGKVLQDNSWATWSEKGGVKAKINAIVSIMAADDKQ